MLITAQETAACRAHPFFGNSGETAMTNNASELEQLSRTASSFRTTMNAYADAFTEAVAKGHSKQMFAALRSYIDLIEVSIPHPSKRADIGHD
jgi:hypothetical protein